MRKILMLLMLPLSLPMMSRELFTEMMIVKDTTVIMPPQDQVGLMQPEYSLASSQVHVHDAERHVFDHPEVMPEYPGGISGIMRFLCDNLRYPVEAVENKIEGRVIVKFVVDKKGCVQSPQVVKSVAPSLDAEALRVIKLLSGFTPGTMNGEPVNVWYSLPITFKFNK